MKRIGTIKFYKELDDILKHSTPYYFKELLITIILDYLTHYSLSEIDIAMENIKKYFYPELLHIYDSVKKNYPTIIHLINYFYQSIGDEIVITSHNSNNILIVTNSLFENFQNDSEKKLLQLIIHNIESKTSNDNFVKAIVQYSSELDVFANIILHTIFKFIARYTLFEKSKIAEINYFEYVGSSFNCRNFCKNKIGKHFHINKINQLNNREINPVIYFGGGLNCFHMWEPDPFYKSDSK